MHARAHLGQLKEGSMGFKLEKGVYYAGEVNMNVVACMHNQGYGF